MFVNFRRRDGSVDQAHASITVGSATTPAAVLTPDSGFVQTGDVRASLTPAGLLTADQPLVLKFKAIDAQGLPLSEMHVIPYIQGQLEIVDESLTTLLRPEFVDYDNLRFSVNFPRPGKYKAWLTFWNPDQRQQVEFVLDVQ